ncbi:MAG: redox-regulated ATPase YchF [Candidatus Spechtbacterales bacterium]|nr:redox-regulated ATPase YchF [Candidatus Spechtbacterales bacterium]
MLSIGIVGLPNVGKSTLFTALTKKDVEIANYPFATIDPNVGVVEVPDERLDKLAELSASAKVIPTAIEFTDIAGLVKGANKGEGLGNQFLANIRETDAILYVVRTFKLADIHHVEDTVDPIRDIETLRTELALKDLESIEKRIDNLEGRARTGDRDAKEELEVVQKLKESLDNDMHVYNYMQDNEMSEKFNKVIKEMQLLTSKPYFFLLNSKGDDISGELREYIEKLGSAYVKIDVREELDSVDLSKEERNELGLGESGLYELINTGYEILNLITFFTTGEKETRAWTTGKGSTAPEAAGKIHTDFQSKFIRAEVIQWDKLLDAGSWANARSKGLIRTEGKEYIVKDGDVMLFLHS